MNSEDFVTAISRYVKDAAIEDTIANLKSPPGRRVPPAERIRSDWYNALPAADAAQVDGIISAAVHEAVFGRLAVLDGARTVDDGAGRFELSYLAPEGRVLLNDPQAIGLHDLLNAAK